MNDVTHDIRDDRLRLLGFGTYDLARHPRVGIVLEGLRARGDDVVELNAPLGFTTAERVAMLGGPWLAYRLALRLIRRWLGLTRRSRAVRRTGRFDAVIVGYLGHFDVLLARLLFPRTRVVLDMMIFAGDTARDRGVTSRWKLGLLDLLDRLAVSCADVVMLDTAEHAELISPAARAKAVVVPVGAPAAWLRAGDAAAKVADPSAPLRVVFFGMYTPLQGTTVIGSALGQLGARTDIAVTMIGTGQDLAATRDAAGPDASVTWLDWVEPAELPGLVASYDVCLGIFGTTAKAQRVVPNKVYQGAAAGCAVVTSDTPPQRRQFGDACRYLAPGDAAALAATLAQLSADRGLTAALQDRARAVAAARFGPSEIVEPLRAKLTGRAADVA